MTNLHGCKGLYFILVYAEYSPHLNINDNVAVVMGFDECDCTWSGNAKTGG